MPDPENVNYYRMREACAKNRAALAASPAIARIHIELANCYARVACADDEIGQIALNQPPDLLIGPPHPPR